MVGHTVGESLSLLCSDSLRELNQKPNEEPCGSGWLLGNCGPAPPLQSLLAMSPEKRRLAAQEVRAPEPPLEEQLPESPYTLEEFSYQFFRCTPHAEGCRKSGLAGAQPEIGREERLQPPCRAKQGQRKPQHRSSHQPSLPGLRRKRPSAGPRCPWPEAGAICGPTPQSHCASHCSNLSTTKPNCGMQPARSSSISFPPTYPNCGQA